MAEHDAARIAAELEAKRAAQRLPEPPARANRRKFLKARQQIAGAMKGLRGT
jgi:hypothetical protein